MVVRACIYVWAILGFLPALAQKNIEFRLLHTWGNAPVSTHASPVQKAMFYVHDFSISQSGKTLYHQPQPQLFNAFTDSPFTQKLLLVDTSALYIKFTIGLPDTVLQSGIGEGVLDPLNGMFWTWQTGYVFVKCEAVFNQQKYSYHIGGMSPLPDARKTFTSKITLPAGAQQIQWLVNWQQFIVPKMNRQLPLTCHTPGALALLLANNFVQAHSFLIL